MATGDEIEAAPQAASAHVVELGEGPDGPERGIEEGDVEHIVRNAIKSIDMLRLMNTKRLCYPL